MYITDYYIILIIHDVVHSVEGKVYSSYGRQLEILSKWEMHFDLIMPWLIYPIDSLRADMQNKVCVYIHM